MSRIFSQFFSIFRMFYRKMRSHVFYLYTRLDLELENSFLIELLKLNAKNPYSSTYFIRAREKYSRAS